ncbi:MAG TPA: hypothetical protein VH040_14215 [Usitatibacter sp.]|nr:hypothetical protein [Usitatibacter sp.]
MKVAVAGMEQSIRALAPVCQDAPQTGDVPWRLLLSAAQSGHVPSMTRFVTSGATHSGIEWDVEALAAYRTFAMPFLSQAAAAGDVSAIETLGKEHLETSHGTRAVPFDPVRGRAYLMALYQSAAPGYRERLKNEIENGTRSARLDDAEVRAADAMAPTLLPPNLARNAAGEIEKPDAKADGVSGCDT